MIKATKIWEIGEHFTDRGRVATRHGASIRDTMAANGFRLVTATHHEVWYGARGDTQAILIRDASPGTWDFVARNCPSQTCGSETGCLCVH